MVELLIFAYTRRVCCTQRGDIWYTLRQHLNMHLTINHLIYTGTMGDSFMLLLLLKLTFEYEKMSFWLRMYHLSRSSGLRCTADCGWITGHSYVTYGPLLNAATVVVFEGVSCQGISFLDGRFYTCKIVYTI